MVTGPIGYPAAVLIRGVDTLAGPGSLMKALGITGAMNGLAATEGTGVWLEAIKNALAYSARRALASNMPAPFGLQESIDSSWREFYDSALSDWHKADGLDERSGAVPTCFSPTKRRARASTRSPVLHGRASFMFRGSKFAHAVFLLCVRLELKAPYRACSQAPYREVHRGRLPRH